MGTTTARRGIRSLLASAALIAAGSGALGAALASPVGAASGGVEVHAATVHGRGSVLVDGAGYTLYVFGPDKGHGPTCHGACASLWPPLTTTGQPAAGHGIRPSDLGTVAGPNGTRQVTYDHWPLYTFVQDTAPGQDTGQGIDSFGGKWSTISPSGSAFGATSGSKHPSDSSSSSGGGWGS